MRTVVHLLRHGEVHNPAGILYGRLPDYHLSGLGVKMAAEVADALAGRDLAHLRSSPMERAQETARPLADRSGLPVVVDERLIEGENLFEGERFAVGDGALRNVRKWWLLRNPFRPSWGEPYARIAARMTAALHAARAAAAGHEAVCVSHQLPIWMLRRHASGARLWHDPRRRQCALASLTSFHFNGDELVDIRYAEPAAHLVARSPGAGTARGA
jgi:broad specificity phosphatase PhoE